MSVSHLGFLYPASQNKWHKLVVNRPTTLLISCLYGVQSQVAPIDCTNNEWSLINLPPIPLVQRSDMNVGFTRNENTTCSKLYHVLVYRILSKFYLRTKSVLLFVSAILDA